MAVFMNTAYLYISEDYGKTWRTYSLGFTVSTSGWGSIVWSGDRWVIGLPPGRILQSTDL